MFPHSHCIKIGQLKTVMVLYQAEYHAFTDLALGLIN